LVRRADDEVDQARHTSLRARARRLDPQLVTNWNDEPKPLVWHKTADEILNSLAAYCHRINNSEH
jgi:hypothetical protein